MAQHYLVIGGCGMLGSSLVKMLLERGHRVSSFDIREPKIKNNQVAYFVGDLCNAKDLEKAFNNVDIVIHTASPPHGLAHSVYFKVNVNGTRNVIAACHAHKVKKLVYTSSASAIFNGTDIICGDETIPYCETHMDAYNESKCIAEQLVLEANSKKLLTVIIRPSGIFGPGDMQMSWVVYNDLSKKFNRFFGPGDNTALFDFTYVDNVSWAHILAAENATLKNGIAGQIFNITNDEPMFFFDFVRVMLEDLGSRPAHIIPVPFFLLYFFAYILDAIAWMLSPIVKIEFAFSVFRVTFMAKNQQYSIEKAKNVLKYRPIISLQDGVHETVKWLKTFD